MKGASNAFLPHATLPQYQGRIRERRETPDVPHHIHHQRRLHDEVRILRTSWRHVKARSSNPQLKAAVMFHGAEHAPSIHPGPVP